MAASPCPVCARVRSRLDRPRASRCTAFSAEQLRKATTRGNRARARSPRSPRIATRSGSPRTVDLLYAFYNGNSVGFAPGQLGAAHFLPTVVVPLLLITHGLMFRLLLQGEDARASR